MLFVEDEYFPAQSVTVRAAGPGPAAQLGCRAGYTPPPLLHLCSPNEVHCRKLKVLSSKTWPGFSRNLFLGVLRGRYPLIYPLPEV